QALVPLGIAREERAYSPHLTLARSGSGRPGRKPDDRANSRFRLLEQKLAAMPAADFGTMTPREFFLFQSKVTSGGARYTKIARFPLS
ncbi:MAG: 2'-5' RNA ligase family protein, partial [Terriglobales bacterium]